MAGRQREALAPANKMRLDQALQKKQHSSIWPYTGFTIPNDKSVECQESYTQGEQLQTCVSLPSN